MDWNLKKNVPDTDIYVSKRFYDQAPQGAKFLETPMAPTLKKTWSEYDCHIHIISVGAVVRMIAPLLKDKKTDPAVICVDDANKFSVCLLSGHVGRGNEFTQQVSEVLQNTPVITTASDVSGTLTVDILGRKLGWVLDDPDRNVTRGCAAVVNQTKVAFIQESGEAHFWPEDKKLPLGVEYYTALEQVTDPDKFEILLVATDRDFKKIYPKHWENAVIYRPPSIILGMGCDRDCPLEVLEEGIRKYLDQEKMSFKSIKAIATIDKKANEKSLIEICDKYNWQLITYAADKLDKVKGVQNPSDVVKKYMGTRSVAEAACLLATQSEQLLLAKQKFQLTPQGKNMTLAMARYFYTKRREHGEVSNGSA